MARNHVHFAAGLPESDGVISGMRATSEVKRSPFYPPFFAILTPHSCEQVAIHLDVAAALRAGIRLYRSTNGVLLSPGDAQFAAAVHTVASDAIGDDEMLAALGRWAMSNAGLSPLTPPTPVQGGATTTKSSLE